MKLTVVIEVAECHRKTVAWHFGREGLATKEEVVVFFRSAIRHALAASRTAQDSAEEETDEAA